MVLTALGLILVFPGDRYFIPELLYEPHAFSEQEMVVGSDCSLFISIIAGIFTVANGYNQWMAVLVPASFIIANAWFAERKKWITTIFFYLFVAVVIFAQWYPCRNGAGKVPTPGKQKAVKSRR